MGCQKGKESELVINMLGKAAYVENNKGCKYVCVQLAVVLGDVREEGKVAARQGGEGLLSNDGHRGGGGDGGEGGEAWRRRWLGGDGGLEQLSDAVELNTKGIQYKIVRRID